MNCERASFSQFFLLFSPFSPQIIYTMAYGGDDGPTGMQLDRPRRCMSRNCDNLLSVGDSHTSCMFCMGLTHARKAFETPGFCPCCILLDDREKGRRIARVSHHLERMSRAAPDDWPDLPRPGGGLVNYFRAPTSTATGPDPGAVPKRQGLARRGPSPPRKAQRTGAYAGRLDDDERSFLEHRDRWDDFTFDRPRLFDEDRRAPRPDDRYTPPPDVRRAPRREDHDDLPPLIYEGRDWGDVMDEVDQVEDYDRDDYQIVDMVGYDDVDHDDFRVHFSPLRDEDAPAVDAPAEDAPAGDAPAEGAPAPDGPPAEAAAAAAAPAPALPTDDRELVDLFRQAAARGGRPWPEEAPPPPEEDEWPGLRPRKVVKKVVLPVAQGFKASYTACWNTPLTTPATPRRSRVPFDMADMPSLCLDGMPAIDRTVGAFLQNPTQPRIVPLTHDPTFPQARDRSASAANAKHYDLITSAAKHLNASALLQNSQTKLLEQMGDAPTPEQLAEVRRLQEESVVFTCCLADLLGRMATAAIIAERVRWLESSPGLPADAHRNLLKSPIVPGGLFKEALEKMALEIEGQRPAVEALAAFIPRAVAARARGQGRAQGQPPRQPPRPPPRQQRPVGDRAPRLAPRQRLDRGDVDPRPPPPPPADREGRRRRPGDQRQRPAPQAGPRKPPRAGRGQQSK